MYNFSCLGFFSILAKEKLSSFCSHVFQTIENLLLQYQGSLPSTEKAHSKCPVPFSFYICGTIFTTLGLYPVHLPDCTLFLLRPFCQFQCVSSEELCEDTNIRVSCFKWYGSVLGGSLNFERNTRSGSQKLQNQRTIWFWFFEKLQNRKKCWFWLFQNLKELLV